MTPPLAVIVPTRGRPANAARLAQAFQDTDALNAVPVFVIDQGDREYGAYQHLLDTGQIPRLVTLPEQGGTGMTRPLNTVARRYADQYEAVGFMGDDHLPRTGGWDGRVLDELDSLEPRIVYGNDLLQGANLPTAVFMQSRMVRALGWMAPPVLRHLYVDDAWKALGEALNGLRYLDDVVIEHLHPVLSKAAWDEGYARVNSAQATEGDRLTWETFRDGTGFALALRHVRDEYGQ